MTGEGLALKASWEGGQTAADRDAERRAAATDEEVIEAHRRDGWEWVERQRGFIRFYRRALREGRFLRQDAFLKAGEWTVGPEEEVLALPVTARPIGEAPSPRRAPPGLVVQRGLEPGGTGQAMFQAPPPPRPRDATPLERERARLAKAREPEVQQDVLQELDRFEGDRKQRRLTG